MSTLFISDLHLDPSRPGATRLFLDFLEGEARGAAALYILGDLFEAWIGDDDDAPLGREVASALAALAATGVDCALMRGNRDFLIGQAFAAAAGCTLLPDPTVVRLAGRPTLLMHGDTLCTDDVGYQDFRRQVRDPAWQASFLSQPLDARRAFAAKARAASAEHQQGRDASIGDVNPGAVLDCLRLYGVDRMIHGHTHRPAIHVLEVDGRPAERIVLGDWYEQGSVLRVDNAGAVELQGLAFPR